jgi:hypothetical protein
MRPLLMEQMFSRMAVIASTSSSSVILSASTAVAASPSNWPGKMPPPRCGRGWSGDAGGPFAGVTCSVYSFHSADAPAARTAGTAVVEASASGCRSRFGRQTVASAPLTGDTSLRLRSFSAASDESPDALRGAAAAAGARCGDTGASAPAPAIALWGARRAWWTTSGAPGCTPVF